MTEKERIATKVRLLLFIRQANNISILLDATRKAGDQLPLLSDRQVMVKGSLETIPITARTCEEVIAEGVAWLQSKDINNFVIGRLICTDADLRGIGLYPDAEGVEHRLRKAYLAIELSPRALDKLLGYQPMDAETFALANARDGHGLQEALLRNLDTIRQREPTAPTEIQPLRRAA